MPQVRSGGVGQAGRVLEFVDQRLEQQNDQQMSEDMGSGGPLVGSWRPLQADQALQPLEAEFNPPSQPVQCQQVPLRGPVPGPSSREK